MSQSTALDYFWALLTFGMVGIGLISMAVGQIVAWWDRWHAPAPRRSTPRRRRVMSRPQLVRRRAEPVRWMPEPAELVAVRSHQHQVEPIEPDENEPAREPIQLNRLSRAAEIALLAVQRNEDGSYRHSANAITQFVGGTAADVKKQIAGIRALPPEQQPRPATRVDRPPRGWPKTA